MVYKEVLPVETLDSGRAGVGSGLFADRISLTGEVADGISLTPSGLLYMAEPLA